MARGSRYVWRARGRAGGARRVPIDAYTGSSFAEKREYQLRRIGVSPNVLFECRLCRVKVIERDREGHLRRNHSPAADVLVVFRVVKNAK